MADQQFNRGKFKELVLYLAQKSAEAGDEGFGMVKLNKLLHHIDFEAYRLLGHSVTGEIYQRQEWGPVARDLPVILDQLGGRYLIWQLVERGPYTRKVPVAIEAADTTQFSQDELDLIDRALDELAEYGGKSVSEWSHRKSVGWNEVEDGQAIPYHSALFSTDPIPEDDVERARQLAIERGWASLVHP